MTRDPALLPDREDVRCRPYDSDDRRQRRHERGNEAMLPDDHPERDDDERDESNFECNEDRQPRGHQQMSDQWIRFGVGAAHRDHLDEGNEIAGLCDTGSDQHGHAGDPDQTVRRLLNMFAMNTITARTSSR
jgi:hypothetical protein